MQVTECNNKIQITTVITSNGGGRCVLSTRLVSDWMCALHVVVGCRFLVCDCVFLFVAVLFALLFVFAVVFSYFPFWSRFSFCVLVSFVLYSFVVFLPFCSSLLLCFHICRCVLVFFVFSYLWFSDLPFCSSLLLCFPISFVVLRSVTLCLIYLATLCTLLTFWQ